MVTIKDDGSKTRHTYGGFWAGFVSCLLIPWGGKKIASLGMEWWEKGKTDSDSLNDIKYGEDGSFYGSLIGSIISSTLWSMIILIETGIVS